ncbi:MAG TPA: TIGR04222 domain-containing membrane protein [Tepidisphaeraceae bacterium]|jgi:uncharacterized protein (TIGR04222 family)
MDLLDLRGPEFLKYYAILFVLAVVAGIVIRQVVKSTDGGARDGGRTANGEDLDPLEVAYLAGGPRLAINTAIASLYRRGAIRLTAGTRSLQAVRPPETAVHALERSLYVAVAAEKSSAVQRVHQRVSGDLAAGRLRARGLVYAAGRRAMIAVPSVLPLLLLFTLGIARIGIGLSRDRPVGFLVLFCFATAIAAIIMLARAPRRTAAGDATLRSMRTRGAALRSTATASPGSLAPADFALAMGLFGPTVLLGEEMGDLRRAINPPSGVGTSSCGSGCGGGSGCSSGGGGGCGGGGCGGCGGGGCGG